MFKKKPTIKPLSPLRSSDRRRTADQIISDLGLDPPAKHATDPEDKAAATAALTSLRNSLLPDNTLSARFTTTAGPELKQVSGTVYAGSHAGEEQRILWVKLEEKMYPTVYTLWHNPGILPLLHTPSFVVSKLQGGADLMTPGLAGGPPFPEKAKKGAIVAVASTDNPTVPLVVGRCEIDVSALQQVQGAKGHAVETVHWSGDEVWAWSASSKPGVNPPEEIDGWLVGGGESGLEAQTEEFKLSGVEEDGGVSLDAGHQKTQYEVGKATAVDGEEESKEEDMAEEETPLTTKEIDDAFRKAFLYGVYHHKQTNRNEPNFGLDFPLTQSFVMANLVQPFLPAFTSSQTNQLQIKKTSWKTIKKFIKSLDKENILKSKDRPSNETVIMDIDFEDRNILSFTPYRLPKKETANGTSLGRGDKATSTLAPDSADSSIGQKLKLLQLYRPPKELAPIFAAAKANSHGVFTKGELAPIITTYVESENLVSPTNRRLVKLNPVLANAVFDSNSKLDKEVIAKGSVPRDALIDGIAASCAPSHVILRNTDAPDSSTKPKAGLPPKISLTIETRSGSKTVTKISGLEVFFIAPQPLADELRKACAGSTSVERLHGSSPKNPVAEVMVQGPQKDAVLRALAKRGVLDKWVDVVDKTKKKKG